MKKKLLIASLCAMLLVTGCGQKAKLKDGKEVVAEIEGKTITAEDLYDELRSQGGTTVLINMIDEFIANKEIETDESAKEYAQNQLDTLKAQYEQSGQDFTAALTSAGYKNENEFKELLILDYKKNKVVENYISDNLTDEEIQEYYDNDVFGEMTVKHILITPETTDDMSEEDTEKAENEAKKKAEEVIEKLNNGEKFDDLVKEYSDDEGSKDNNGLVENFTKDGVVSEFWDASIELKDGEYTKEPVKSEYGYHVIYRVSQKEKAKLKDVKDDIKEKLVEEKLNSDAELATKTWVEIRKKYKLDIKDDDIKKAYNESND